MSTGVAVIEGPIASPRRVASDSCALRMSRVIAARPGTVDDPGPEGAELAGLRSDRHHVGDLCRGCGWCWRLHRSYSGCGTRRAGLAIVPRRACAGGLRLCVALR